MFILPVAATRAFYYYYYQHASTGNILQAINILSFADLRSNDFSNPYLIYGFQMHSFHVMIFPHSSRGQLSDTLSAILYKYTLFVTNHILSSLN